jgi:mono/diheme cytochrome c family protein
MKRWMKRVGYLLGGLVALILVATAAVYGFSEARLRKQYTISPTAMTIPTDTIAVARGAHLSQTVAGCSDCHGLDLAGHAIVDDAALGRIYSANLTRGKGGVGSVLSDVDFVRAIRHGVAPDGRPLKIMPSSDYMNLSDVDLAAIIAFVKSLPPVDKEVPIPSVGPLGRALFVAGKLPFLHAERIDHSRKQPAAMAGSATAEYGAYLAGVGCKGCHGPSLAGGPIIDGPPDWPQAANLTPAGALGSWTDKDFQHLLREGKRPDGSQVSPVMPWKTMGRMTDEEIAALWAYLRTLPATPSASARTASR